MGTPTHEVVLRFIISFDTKSPVTKRPNYGEMTVKKG